MAGAFEVGPCVRIQCDLAHRGGQSTAVKRWNELRSVGQYVFHARRRERYHSCPLSHRLQLLQPTETLEARRLYKSKGSPIQLTKAAIRDPADEFHRGVDLQAGRQRHELGSLAIRRPDDDEPDPLGMQ